MMLTTEKSLTIKPHAKLSTPEEFKTHIKLDSILGNKTIAEFIKPARHNPESTRPMRFKYLESCDSSSRFDTIISYEWEKSRTTCVPSISIQREARALQLNEMYIPSISRNYFFTNIDEFTKAMTMDIKQLNESSGDLLDKDNGFTEYKFKPVAVMTDYKGVIDDNCSFSTSKKLIGDVIKGGVCIPALIKTRNIVNYIGVVFASTIESYDNYQQYVLHSPNSHDDTKYIRYVLLTTMLY